MISNKDRILLIRQVIAMNIKTGKLCSIGGRKKNDDTVMIASDSGYIRLYVGDGLGSYAGGKQASETAGQALMACRGSMLGDEELRSAAHMANQAVYDLQKSTDGTMKTTLVFLTIEDEKARWMHVGDSRLYHFKDGKLISQTTDHSVSQMAVMMGEITTHQIRFHEDRNRVLRSLGGENAKPELSPVTDISDGDHAFLLCSDGFWEYVYEAEMEQTLCQAKDPDDWIASMEQILQGRITGNNDNYTAAAAFCSSGKNVPAVSRNMAPVESRPARKRNGGLLITLALILAIGAAGTAFFLHKFRGDEKVQEAVVVTEESNVVETSIHIVTPEEVKAAEEPTKETPIATVADLEEDNAESVSNIPSDADTNISSDTDQDESSHTDTNVSSDIDQDTSSDTDVNVSPEMDRDVSSDSNTNSSSDTDADDISGDDQNRAQD